VVFDRDLTRVHAREIVEARCVMTLVDGNVVWEEPAPSGEGRP
jgi:predicted amidohydrolase YtcJ